MNKTETKVRLTQMVTSAGCAAKIFPDILSETLKDIQWHTNENVLVGFEGRDDAGGRPEVGHGGAEEDLRRVAGAIERLVSC